MSRLSLDHPGSILKSAAHFFSGTFLSRLSGLGREVAFAFCFGATPTLAIFLMALRFANLIRRLFGEGALLAGFAPYFEEIRRESPRKGAYFFRDLFFSLLLFLGGLILLIEGVLVAIWMWGGVSSSTEEILCLTMVMVPGVMFLCFYALFSAHLHCERRYFLSGVAPIVFNGVLIAAIWHAKDRPSVEVGILLSLAATLAFFLQWLMVAPPIFRSLRQYLSWKEWIEIRFFSAELQQMIKGVLLTLIGVGAVQINSALDPIFARFASLSGPAYLYYANRLQQLPLALFGVALAAALLPPLSRAYLSESFERYGYLFRSSLVRSFHLMMPVTVFTLLLGASGVNLIYGRGNFDLEATCRTVECLWGYGMGLIPAVWILLIVPAFYAQKDYKTPLIGSCLSLLVNGILNSVMVFCLGWGVASIALATTVATLANAIYLLRALSLNFRSHKVALFEKTTLLAFFKTASLTLVAGGITVLIGNFFIGDPSLQLLCQGTSLFPRAFSGQLIAFFTLAGCFWGSFLGLIPLFYYNGVPKWD